MATLHHFTTGASITTQIPGQAFGKLPTVDGLERYNLENKFSVTAGAPAFAPCKSRVIYLQDVANNQLLNVVAFPVASSLAGLPVKAIIYRGLTKSALIDSAGNVQQDDSSWSSDNVLKTVKDLQLKISNATGVIPSPVPQNCLGVQFSNDPDDKLLEAPLFDDSSNFHPLIVEGGCQIGKFSGGETPAGVEVILDRIGYDPTIKLLKSGNHILEIPELVLSPSDTAEEQLIKKFNNRFRKEEILGYMDITALYGCYRNRGLTISGTSSGDAFLASYLNKNSVYIDVRDRYGFSYNHFLGLRDTLSVGFAGADNNFVFQEHHYYAGWPILRLDAAQYATAKANFQVRIPIEIGDALNRYYVTNFADKIASVVDGQRRRSIAVGGDPDDGHIQLNATEPLRLRNWCYSDNKLGSNYFLLKIDATGDTVEGALSTNIWKNRFSMKMKNVFGTTNMQEGHFSVNTYAAYNSPVISDAKAGEVYYAVSGIAVDKENVTFFSFRDEPVFTTKESGVSLPAYPLTGKGKFYYPYDEQSFQYDGGAVVQNVGFLAQMANKLKIPEYNLRKVSATNSFTQETHAVATYARNQLNDRADEIMDYFDAISLTHAEYNALLAFQENQMGSFPGHPAFICVSASTSRPYIDFDYEEHTLSLAVPTVVWDETNETPSIQLQPTSSPITLNNEPISVSGGHF